MCAQYLNVEFIHNTKALTQVCQQKMVRFGMCTSWGETVLFKVIVLYKNGENSDQEGRFE